MSVRTRGALITWTTGRPDAAPVLLLHDRYLDHESTNALATLLARSNRVVSVRSARTQMEMGQIKGYYWYLGALDHPELSTLGDALTHLERLVLDIHREGGRRVALAGAGEGGSIALLMGLLWPEIISGVCSIDGPLPANIAEMPLALSPADGMPMLLVERNVGLGATMAALALRGATVNTDDPSDADIASWLAALNAG
jgi:hypothetical protein